MKTILTLILLAVLSPLLGLMVYWYMHIWFPSPLAYWKCVIIAVVAGILVEQSNVFKWIWASLLPIAVVLQVANRCGAVVFPIIK